MPSPTRTPRRRTRATLAQSIPEGEALSPGWTSGSADLFKMPASSSPVQTKRVTRRTSLYRKGNQKKPGQSSMLASIGEPAPKSKRTSVYKKASPAKRAKVASPKRKPKATQIKKPIEPKLTKLKSRTLQSEDIPGAPSLLAKATPSIAKRNATVFGRSLKPASPKKNATSPKKIAKTEEKAKSLSPKKITKATSPKKHVSLKKNTKTSSPKKITKVASPKKRLSPNKNAKTSSPKKIVYSATTEYEASPASPSDILMSVSPRRATKALSHKKNTSSKKRLSGSLRKTAKLVSQGTPKSIRAKKAKKIVTVAFSQSMNLTPTERRSSKVLRQRSQNPQTPFAAEVYIQSVSAKKSAKKTKKKAVTESTSPSLSPSNNYVADDSPVFFKTPIRSASTTGASTRKSAKSVTIVSPMTTPRIMAAPKSLVSELDAADTSQEYLSPPASSESTKPAEKIATRTPRSRKRVAQTSLTSPPKSKVLIQSNGQSPSGDGPDIKGYLGGEEKENGMKLDESTEVVAVDRQESQVWSWCAIL